MKKMNKKLARKIVMRQFKITFKEAFKAYKPIIKAVRENKDSIWYKPKKRVNTRLFTKILESLFGFDKVSISYVNEEGEYLLSWGR